MSAQELESTVETLRSVELRRAVRGVDPDQARKLLEEAADSLAAAMRQQEELRHELQRLRSNTNDQDAIAKALLVATRAAEEIVAEAARNAASITTEAEAQAAAVLERAAVMLEQRERETAAAREEFELELAAARRELTVELESARAEAEASLADARRELPRLEAEAARLHSLVTDTERHVVEIVKGALDELESLGSDVSDAEADLLGDLRPAAG